MGGPRFELRSGQIAGLLRPGLRVSAGLKAGDVDHRGDREMCFMISEKARARGGDAMETILMRFSS